MLNTQFCVKVQQFPWYDMYIVYPSHKSDKPASPYPCSLYRGTHVSLPPAADLLYRPPSIDRLSFSLFVNIANAFNVSWDDLLTFNLYHSHSVFDEEWYDLLHDCTLIKKKFSWIYSNTWKNSFRRTVSKIKLPA